ncbi:MAG: helix-turn-helix transcriptional regulator [Oscillospiraceae bacterium]|nr:helix-turn-helix transcriptional regulator [Oscillospiraceae bacterium]
MARIIELSGLIYSKYEKECQLADELGWPRQRLNKIVNGKKEPDLEEVVAIASKLDRPVGEMVNLFLRYKSPNRQLMTS